MTDTPPAAIAQSRADILDRISRTAGASGRSADEVTLVAVSKRQSDARIAAALAAGQVVFGENRVQEAQAHWPAERKARYGVQLRLIGPLQTNKAEEAVQLFDVIETVDRPKLVRALAAAMEKTGLRPACLVQVNTGEEPQKSGVLPQDLEALLAVARECGLTVDGLMCLPPVGEPAGPHFAFLAKLADRHELATLSMGMSGDFETAIRFGATHVRVGSALFGSRQA